MTDVRNGHTCLLWRHIAQRASRLLQDGMLVGVGTTRKFGFYDSIFDQQTYEHATLVVPAGIFEIYANSLVFGMFRYKTEAFE